VIVDCRETEALLPGYVDGELGRGESGAVRDHIAACAACRERLVNLESLGRMVRAAPYYAAPDRLRARIAIPPARSAWTPSLLRWAAVLILGASLAGSGLLVRRSITAAHSAEAGDAIAEDIVSTHVRASMGDHLFDVRSTDQHTVKPWFAGKLDFSPPVQDFATIGFPLVGGRLDYVAGHAAAGLVYQRQKHVIDVLIWPDSASVTTPATHSIRGFHLRHWTQSGMSFWAVSDLNDAELDQFVAALRQ
jgi:anti-sigma factor RsiW